jgi:hypothetical protein
MFSFANKKQQKIQQVKRLQQMYNTNRKLAHIAITNNIKSKKMMEIIQNQRFACYNFNDNSSVFNDNSSVFDDSLSVFDDSLSVCDDTLSMLDEEYINKEGITFDEPVPKKQAVAKQPVAEEQVVENQVVAKKQVTLVKLAPVIVNKLNSYWNFFYKKFNRI